MASFGDVRAAMQRGDLGEAEALLLTLPEGEREAADRYIAQSAGEALRRAHARWRGTLERLGQDAALLGELVETLQDWPVHAVRRGAIAQLLGALDRADVPLAQARMQAPVRAFALTFDAHIDAPMQLEWADREGVAHARAIFEACGAAEASGVLLCALPRFESRGEPVIEGVCGAAAFEALGRWAPQHTLRWSFGADLERGHTFAPRALSYAQAAPRCWLLDAGDGRGLGLLEALGRDLVASAGQARYAVDRARWG